MKILSLLYGAMAATAMAEIEINKKQYPINAITSNYRSKRKFNTKQHSKNVKAKQAQKKARKQQRRRS